MLTRDDSPLAQEWRNSFEVWVAALQAERRLRQPGSVAVYRAMWGALAGWAVAHVPPLRPLQLDSAALMAFIASRQALAGQAAPLTPRYRWRLLNLVDRIERHHTSAQGLAKAGGAAARLIAQDPSLRLANVEGNQALPDHLAPDDAKRLVVLLSSAWRQPGQAPGLALTKRQSADKASGPFQVANGATAPTAPTAPTAHSPTKTSRLGLMTKPDWQRWRDRAAVGLQLGAGLTPGDVRALKLGHLVRSGAPATPRWLRVPANGSAPAHETPIAPWAARLLQGWLDVRTALLVPGDWLFPATRSGGAWGKVAQYDATQRVLADAGLDHLRDGGSFRLRHTFALRQLKRGRSTEDVARWLGVVDAVVMGRYQRAMDALVDELA